MFETSMVLARTQPAPRRVGLLTASLIAHSAAIIGAVALSVASVDFPRAAPNEAAVFMPVQPPPPLGNPNGGAPPKPAAAPPVQKQAPPPPTPNQITAPPAIPEDVTPVDAPSSPGDSTTTGSNTDGLVPGPVGVPWGDPNGVGPLDAPPAVVNTPAVEEKVYTPGGEIKAPVLLHRVDPAYPEIMRRSRVSGVTVGLRCIIDKNGRVRDPEVILPAMAPFNDAVISAVKQWRYQAGSLRGQAVETYLNVTVTFSVH